MFSSKAMQIDLKIDFETANSKILNVFKIHNRAQARPKEEKIVIIETRIYFPFDGSLNKN